MTLCRVVHDKNNPYLTINTTISTDKRLSWKAKGIWFYAFSQKNDWKFYFKELQRHSTDGRDSLKAGLKELEEAGYLYRRARIDPSNGKMAGQEWYFFESARTKEQIDADFPKRGKPVTREPSSPDNRPLTTNNPEQVRKEQQPRDEEAAVSSPKIEESDVPGLSAERHTQLVKAYGAERVAAKVALLQARPEQVPNPYGWLRKAIEEDWQAPLSAEDLIPRNRQLARDKFGQLDGKEIGVVRIEVLHKAMEFIRGGQGDNVHTIPYSSQFFETEVRAHVKMLQERQKQGATTATGGG